MSEEVPALGWAVELENVHVTPEGNLGAGHSGSAQASSDCPGTQAPADGGGDRQPTAEGA